MPRVTLIALAFLMLICRTAYGQDAPSQSDRFKLYNLCAPVRLVIEKLPNDLASIGLSEAQLEALAESRLRVADLYEEDALTFLHIEASRYVVQLQYRKPVIDVASSETGLIRTLSKVAEVRDGTAAGVMLEVSRLLDQFLAEYLRVNEPACRPENIPERAVRDNTEIKRPEPSDGGSRETERTGGTGGIRWGRMWPVPESEQVEPSVHRTGEGVTSPRLIHKVDPEYSNEARDAKLQGTVMLAVEVWEDGKAHNIRVLRSLGMGLDEKAIEAVRQWTFNPGRKDGKPVKVAAQIQVGFRIVVRP